MNDSLIAQGGIERTNGNVLLEATHSWHEPLLPCLSKDDNVLPRLMANDTQALAKVVCHVIHFGVRQPGVVAQFELFGEKGERLRFVIGAGTEPSHLN